MTPFRSLVDGVGRPVTLPAPPARIVSLVPSTTETLAALGVRDRVVGCTRYCVHPRPWVEDVPRVGGTKNPDLEAIAALRPDLIVANQEENKPEHFDDLAALAPLWVAYPRTVDEALADLRGLAALVGAEEAGAEAGARIEAAREAARRRAAPGFRYAYMIWHQPWMTVNGDTFIDAMLREVGGANAFGAHPERYPQVTLDDLAAADPDVVLLSSEPFPFAERHRDELGPLAPRARLVDGEACSWHGVRMAHGLAVLEGLAATRPRRASPRVP